MAPKSDRLLPRRKIQECLDTALKYPIVLMRAGTGYGKTEAMRLHRFEKDYMHVTWLRLNEHDNNPVLFWEQYKNAAAKIHPVVAKRCANLDLPNNHDNINEYVGILRKSFLSTEKYVLVFDDLHKINNYDVLLFIDMLIHADLDVNWSIVLITQTDPDINMNELYIEDKVYEIDESKLKLDRDEVEEVLHHNGIKQESDSIDRILEDTAGCIFTLNLVIALLKNGKKYIKGMIKGSINSRIESAVWAHISDRLKTLVLQMSLIDTLADQLVSGLAGNDKALVGELHTLHAYIGYDSFRKTYEIHDLFKDFLDSHKNDLSESDRRSTLYAAAELCVEKNVKSDAIRYYCYVNDFEKASWIILNMHMQLAPATAKSILDAFKRADDEYTKATYVFPIMRMRLMLSLGWLKETLAQADHEEEMYLEQPDSVVKFRKLSFVYTARAIARHLLGAVEDKYDFAGYYETALHYYQKAPYPVDGPTRVHPVCSWAAWVGTSRKGAVDEYIVALRRAIPPASECQNGYMSGLEELAIGEQLFYQNKLSEAEKILRAAVNKAAAHGQYDVRHVALRYQLRINLAQGKKAGADARMQEIDEQLNEQDFLIRSDMRDLAKAVYCLGLNQPDEVPINMKGEYVECAFGVFKENVINHIRIKERYAQGEYLDVLLYSDFEEKCEIIIYGKIDWLVFKALAQFKLMRREEALSTLEEAYRLAEPNNYIMSFIERGQDMVELLKAAGKASIPAKWRNEIKREALEFANQQARMIGPESIREDIVLTPREHDFLVAANSGLNYKEIAVKYGLSPNTVNNTLKSAKDRLGTNKLTDAIRIAKELRLLT
ncbi:hypothetical protein AGMMS49992_23870 [Clostridia bacterium]|nr:hypothetical protein AGMMS49992_23870 [Clostridia bacterium]